MIPPDDGRPPEGPGDGSQGPAGGSSDDMIQAGGPGRGQSPRPPSPTADSDSDDFFQAVSPGAAQRGRSAEESDDVDFAPPPPVERAKDSEATTLAHGGIVDLSRGGIISALASIESDLEEVPEVATPLIRIIDEFVEATADVLRGALIEFSELAATHLARWEVEPGRVEQGRFDRLRTAGQTPDSVHEAILDLKVSARWLAQVRPEEFLDIGTWNLWRDVRACVRTDDVEFLARTLRALDKALAESDNHLLAPYKPRLIDRYGGLVRRAILEIAPLIEIEPESLEPEDVADTLSAIEPGALFVDKLQRQYPHEVLDEWAQRFDQRREQLLPILRELAERALQSNDLGLVLRAILALERLDPKTFAAQTMLTTAERLRAHRDMLLKHVRDRVRQAIAGREPGPVWTALVEVRGLPDVLCGPETEFGVWRTELQQLHDELLAVLEQDAHYLLNAVETWDSPDAVSGVLERIDNYLPVNPDHPLGALKPPLKDLLSRVRTWQEVRVRSHEMLTDGAGTIVGFRAMAGEVSAVRAPDVLAGDLHRDLLDRADRLEALESAKQSGEPKEVRWLTERATDGLAEPDAELLEPLVSPVRAHLDELLAAKEHESALAEWRGWLETATRADAVELPGRERVEAARAFLAKPGAGMPGAKKPRERVEHLADELEPLLDHLAALAVLPERALQALDLEGGDPAFSACRQCVVDGSASPLAKLAMAPELAAMVARGRDAVDACATMAVKWVETEARVNEAVKAEAFTDALFREATETTANAADARPKFEAADEWLGADGMLLAWFDSRGADLTSLAERARQAAEDLAARRRQRRRMAVLAALLLLLVGAGIAGTLAILDWQRHSRADELLAAVVAVQEAGTVAEIDPPMTEAVSFLDEGSNREDFTELVDAVEQLDRWRTLVAARESELAELLAAAGVASESLVGIDPAAIALVEFRDRRALPTQRGVIATALYDLKAAGVVRDAQPGLEAETVEEVDTHLAAIDEHVAAEESGGLGDHPRVVDIRERLLAHRDALEQAALEAWREQRLTELRELIGEADGATDPAVVREVTDRVETTLAEHRDETLRERLEQELAALHTLHDYLALLASLRGRIQAVIDGTDRYEPVAAERTDIQSGVTAARVPEGRPAVADVLAGPLETLGIRYDLLKAGHEAVARAMRPEADGTTLTTDIRRLEERLAEPGNGRHRAALQSYLDQLAARATELRFGALAEMARPGFLSEDPEQVLVVHSQVRTTYGDAEDRDLRAQAHDVLSRLDRRRAWFERRERLRDRLRDAVEGDDGLPRIGRALEALQAEYDDLHGSEWPEVQLGPPPSGDEQIDEYLAILRLRVEMLQQADTALRGGDPGTLRQADSTISSALDTDAGRPSRNVLGDSLHHIRLLLELIEAVEGVRDSRDAERVSGVVDRLNEALLDPGSSPYRPTLRGLRDDLQGMAEALTAVLAIDAPATTIERELTVTGRVVRGTAPSRVTFYINGRSVAEVPVQGGRFQAVLQLQPGANSVVATAGGFSHSGAARAEIERRMPQIRLSGPDRVTRREATVQGRVSGAQLERVWVIVNDQPRSVDVAGGRFEVIVILLAGENTVIASPTEDPTHEGHDEHTIFADIAQAAVIVTLTWVPENCDVDLHVVQPNGVEVSYRNKTPPGNNGQLDVDMRRDGGPENYSFTLRPGQTMPRGTYHVYLVYYSGDHDRVTATVNVRWWEGTPDEDVLDPMRVELRRSRLKERIKVHEFTVR